jgi:hypothetical protein
MYMMVYGEWGCNLHLYILYAFIIFSADMGQNAAQNNSMHFYHFFRVPRSKYAPMS